jgi:hypothetical protein
MAEIIKFKAGVPVPVALKFDTGKNCDGKFGPQVQYTTVDDGIFWLDPEPASDVEREMKRLGIRAGEFFRLTKTKTSHGGHRFVVERAGDAGGHNVPQPQKPVGREYVATGPAPAMTDEQSREFWGTPSHTEALLEKSIDMARDRGPAAFTSSEPPQRITAQSTKLMACFMQAIDAVTEAQAYCGRKGLGITFTSEDVRSTAIACWISACKEGGR